MKKTAAFLFFCFCLFVVRSQTTNFASLWKTWNDKKQADTIRLDALDNFATEKYLKTQPDSALYCAKMGYDFAAKKNIYSRMAQALNLQGNACRNKKDYTNALKNFTAANDLATAHNIKKQVAFSTMYLGYLYTDQKEHGKALECIAQSNEMWKALNDQKNLLLSMSTEAKIYTRQEQTVKLVRCASEMLDIATAINDKIMIMVSLNTLAIQSQRQSDMVKAYSYCTQMLQMATEYNHPVYLTAALGNMAFYYHEQGDYVKSTSYYQQAAEQARKNDNKASYLNHLINLANIYIRRKMNEEAKARFTEAMEIAKAINDKRLLSSIYNSLGGVYLEEQGPTEGIAALRQSITLAREINYPLVELHASSTLGKAFLDLQLYDSCIVWCTKGLELANTLRVNNQARYAELILAQAYYNLNRKEEAKTNILSLIQRNDQMIKRNFPVFSEKEQELFFNTMYAQYDSFYALSYALSATDPAMTDVVYNTVARNKGLLLRSSTAMRQSVLSGNDTSLIRQYNHWIELNKEISQSLANGKDTKEAEEKANELEKILVKNSQAFSDFGETFAINWKNVQAGLKEKEAAIEFVHGALPDSPGKENAYYALVLKPGMQHPQMIRLCDEEKLAGVLGQFGGNNLSYVNHLYGSKTSANDTLYQLLWKPMENTLKGVKTVYLSPAGLLHKVSFAAMAKDQHTYLCDNYNIKVQGSTIKVAFPGNSTFTSGIHLNVFGGIDYGSDSSMQIWHYLPGTKSETDGIVSLLEKKNTSVAYFNGKDATEDHFKQSAGQNEILHIATHGFFYPDPETVQSDMSARGEKKTVVFRGDADIDAVGIQRFVKNKNPLMRSGLAFAGANGVWKAATAENEKEDGVLTAQEVTQMDLRKTHLVVLSACETGLGDIKGSEGVYGLQRSFKMAGVKFLVMSLWQVPDKETGEFMLMFYEKLVKTKDTRAAFAATQKAIRQKYDPYYWAAFVLVE